MFRQYSGCVAIVAALALSACDKEGRQIELTGGGLELQKVTGMTPTGSEFNRALFSEYLTLSRDEYNQGDYRDSDLYAVRARSSGQGAAVEPQQIAERQLPADKAPELASSRSRLVAALNNGSRERLPRDAAQAQAKFDCWMEQQEENRQPNDVAACRSAFLTALAKIEVVPPPPPEKFTIYFDLNKATLSADAQRRVSDIVSRARALNAKSIAVEGYTDRSGSDKHNLQLSQKREAMVHEAIHKAGLNARITGQSYGEDRPAVATADGAREAQNRRVVVTVTP
jgi:outer membrane protein OmpA-like peptidoglycan-associated protein